MGTNSSDSINAQRKDEDPQRRCPMCGEWILKIAKKCKHCGSMIAKQELATNKPMFHFMSAGKFLNAPEVADLQPDEKSMAGISHIIGLPLSWVGPFIIWVSKKDNSQYVRFQAAQATWFQIVLLATSIIVGLIFMSISEQRNPEIGAICLLLLSSLAWLFAWLIVPVMGLVNSFAGKAFIIPIVGDFFRPSRRARPSQPRKPSRIIDSKGGDWHDQGTEKKSQP